MPTFLDSSKVATRARTNTLWLSHESKSPHVGSSLSCIDILSVLYANYVNLEDIKTVSPNRTRIIVSKGHSASAFYSILEAVGLLGIEVLQNYCKPGSHLLGHITHENKVGVELSTGSLGHGLPYAIGVALSLKKKRISSHVYVIISDGECDEGTTWESALLGAHHNLDNLTVIIDRNRLQSIQGTEDTLKLEPLGQKWESFGWNTRVVNGHNHEEIVACLNELLNKQGPACLIAETIKGFGVDFMESNNLWHYKSPDDSELTSALSQVTNMEKS